MAAFVFAALSAGVGLGVLLIVQGIRGREVLPPAVIDFRGFARSGRLPWIAGAAAVGLAGRAVLVGFPLEVVDDDAQRAALTAALLAFATGS